MSPRSAAASPREGVRCRKRRRDWRTNRQRACLLCGRVWRPRRTADLSRLPVGRSFAARRPQTRRCAAWSRLRRRLGVSAPSARYPIGTRAVMRGSKLSAPFRYATRTIGHLPLEDDHHAAGVPAAIVDELDLVDPGGRRDQVVLCGCPSPPDFCSRYVVSGSCRYACSRAACRAVRCRAASAMIHDLKAQRHDEQMAQSSVRTHRNAATGEIGSSSARNCR